MSSVYFVVKYVDYESKINYHENQYNDMVKQCLNQIDITYIMSSNIKYN